MSRVWNGSDLVKLGTQEVFDPTVGWTWQEEWVGTEAAIDTYLATLDPSVRIARSVRDDQHYLTLSNVTDPGGGTEVPVDSYEMSTEYETVEVWGNPKIQAGTLLNQVTRLADHTDCLARFRRFCETRLRDLYNGYVTENEEALGGAGAPEGKGPTPFNKTGLYSLTSPGSINPVAAADFAYGDAFAAQRVANLARYYWMMTMGTERWPVRQITFNRRRTCSAKYAARHIADGVEYIYTTAALIRDFAIPADVAARLPGSAVPGYPVNPYPPNSAPYTQWAWKIRRQDSQQLPRTGRVEEVIDWVFAAWTLELYNLIT